MIHMECLGCGRKLKDYKSISRGYGPVCYKKIEPKTVSAGSPVSAKRSGSIFEDKDYSVPGQMELSEFIEMPKVLVLGGLL